MPSSEKKFLGTDNDFMMLIATKYYKKLNRVQFNVSTNIPGWLYITVVNPEDEYFPMIAKYALNLVERYFQVLFAKEYFNHE